jgi:hypothetical protein
MRILHVTQGYAPAIGGTERLMQRVSEELVARAGDTVTVFTTDCYNGEAFYTPGLPSLPAGWSAAHSGSPTACGCRSTIAGARSPAAPSSADCAGRSPRRPRT